MMISLHQQGIGDMNLAYQCFRLALASNNDSADAYNNLGVLEMRKGRIEMVYLISNRTNYYSFVARTSETQVIREIFIFPYQARAFFQAAFNLAPHMFEPHYNFASLTDKVSWFLDG